MPELEHDYVPPHREKSMNDSIKPISLRLVKLAMETSGAALPPGKYTLLDKQGKPV
jgi:hypothetical protein